MVIISIVSDFNGCIDVLYRRMSFVGHIKTLRYNGVPNWQPFPNDKKVPYIETEFFNFMISSKVL